jgi:K+-sensing histidine kinase KdpD
MSTREFITQSRPLPPISRYGLALAFVAAALVLTLLLHQLANFFPLFFFFYAAVMVSAWFGGAGPGSISVFLTTLAVDCFFIPPSNSFHVELAELTWFVAFVIAIVLTGVVGMPCARPT